MTGTAIVVRVEEPAWRVSGIEIVSVRAAARLALVRGLSHKQSTREDARGKSLTVLLANDETLRGLNAKFRGKDSPTNVLSFPASPGDGGYLGDVALALGIAVREAAAAGKQLSEHVLHLTVHGVLHLLGYDHERAREARTMERLEIAVLHELGISDPYTARS